MAVSSSSPVAVADTCPGACCNGLMVVSDDAHTDGVLWKRRARCGLTPTSIGTWSRKGAVADVDRTREHSRASEAFDCLPAATSDESMTTNVCISVPRGCVSAAKVQ